MTNFSDAMTVANVMLGGVGDEILRYAYVFGPSASAIALGVAATAAAVLARRLRRRVARVVAPAPAAA